MPIHHFRVLMFFKKAMRYGISIWLMFVFLLSCNVERQHDDAKESNSQPAEKIQGMVWVPGGTFIMGTDEPDTYDHERPAHQVQVVGFWMDETEVTNEQYKAFVEKTGYITVAERKPEWEDLRKQSPPGTPRPHDSLLVAGALVFNPPKETVMLNDYSQWWRWLPGTDWKHPEGPGSNLEGRMKFPVVHVAYEDAKAYCNWADKRLPTEAEWEFASRGGKEQQRYAWGNELKMNGKFMANTFQGSFPNYNAKEDGFEMESPVKSFPPNAYGLYDMIGNLWEWTSDWYDVSYFEKLAGAKISVNPQGPDKTYDPNEPYAIKRVSKGGSFLCADDYCVNYRPSARQGTAFDSGMSNLGFRCVRGSRKQ